MAYRVVQHTAGKSQDLRKIDFQLICIPLFLPLCFCCYLKSFIC